MTDEDKRQLVDAVITELQKNKKDLSTADIINALKGGEMVVCYNNEGKISRISPQAIASISDTKIEDAISVILEELNTEATSRKGDDDKIMNMGVLFGGFNKNVGNSNEYIIPYQNISQKHIGYITIQSATTENAGVLSAGDKKKLDGISTSVYLTEEEYQALVSRGEVQEDVEYNIYEE